VLEHREIDAGQPGLPRHARSRGWQALHEASGRVDDRKPRVGARAFEHERHASARGIAAGECAIDHAVDVADRLEAFDPADAGARKAIAKASGGGVGAAVDFAGSDKSLAFAHSVVAKGGAAIVVGLIGGSFTLPVPMFPLRALTIMGSYVGSTGEAREMLDLVKAGKVAPIPVETRPLGETSRSLDDLRAGKIVGRVVITP